MTTEQLAHDLRHCTYGMLLIVADWMLGHGWTEPLDDAGTTQYKRRLSKEHKRRIGEGVRRQAARRGTE